MEVYRLRVRLGHVGRDNLDGIRVYGGTDGVVVTIDSTRATPRDIEERVTIEVADMLRIVLQRAVEANR